MSNSVSRPRHRDAAHFPGTAHRRHEGAPAPATGPRTPAVAHSTAVIVGGGFAGLLAAWQLRGIADRIIVVERDRYPNQPQYRSGVPQSRHAHLLLEAGHRALETMMPGIRDELLAAGASRVAMSGDLRWRGSRGWMAEHESSLTLLSCTRVVLDHVVRTRIYRESEGRRTDGGSDILFLDGSRVEFCERTEVIGLLGGPDAVTGVRVRRRGEPGSEWEVPAECVIDASARSSSTPQWLTELGCPPVPVQRVDAGVAYTSRLFDRPRSDPGSSAIYLQAHAPDQLRTGVLLPVEGDRWIVSLGGMRGAEPAPGVDGFNAQLAQLDPILGEALRDSEPVSQPVGFRPGPSLRRDYSRAPNGLLVLGDAAAAFNPLYGQGLTVAALAALALRTATVRHGGIGHAAIRCARRDSATVSNNAWMMAASEDRRFAATDGGPAGILTRIQHRFMDWVLTRATSDTHVTAAFQEVMSLVSPPTALLRPPILARVLLGTRTRGRQ